MSIKSQKSLNDECSEIFEKGYSVRSASDESLSCDEDEESLSRELLIKLTPTVLSKLRRCFKKAKDEHAARDLDRRVGEVMRAAASEEGIEFEMNTNNEPQTNLCLDEKGFVAALEKIFGHPKYSSHGRQLFRSLDVLGGGRVWWRQVEARARAAGGNQRRADIWTALQGTVTRLKHCKRETIVKVVGIEREHSFCYVAITRGGRVGVYDGQWELLYSYEVFHHRTGIRRRVKNCWITDLVYLSDVQHLVISASDRSLTIYDVVTLTHCPVFCVTGLTYIPTCLAYRPMQKPGDESELIFGNERGDLTRMRFLQPRISLLHVKTPDNINNYFWMELSSAPHTAYVSMSTWRKVHSRSVRRVAYERDGDIVLSCSHDSTLSVRCRHARGNVGDYVFKVQRGVSCLHTVGALLATGGADGVVRLWSVSPLCLSASLSAPTPSAILDVAIVIEQHIVLAYCHDCTVHIWDLYEECLLQTTKLRFPFLGILGKKVEFGPYCIHFGPHQTQRQLPLEDEGSEEDGTQQRTNYASPRSLLFSCGEYVFAPRVLLPAPAHRLPARKPSAWDVPDFVLGLSPRPAVSKTCSSAKILSQIVTESSSPEDLDDLLEKAGLQGILEKDFVLMRGLKHDLHKKLQEMASNIDATRAAVCVGAPHLALLTAAPTDTPQPPERSRRMRFLQESSSDTPSGSATPTPRSCKLKLPF